ncbi:DUF6545 domain-containing protein [Nocardia sp. NPDC005366]|uniref:DUF6545 domain-containing protein n=1 Tax=Nocardia sp. NPDC005366 TaxID=3156878 RepID=UPI0033B22E46
MTAVPLVPVVLITGFAILVAALRWIFLHDNVTDRLINRALGLAGIGMLIAVVATRPAVPIIVTHLGGIAGLFTASALYGVARMLDGADPKEARLRQRRYDLVALSVSVLTVLINASVVLHLTSVDVSSRWHSACSAASCLPLAVSGFRLMRASIREIRSADTPLAERIAYCSLICVAVFWMCYAPILLVRYRLGLPPDDPGKGWALSGFAFFAVITALLAIPLVRMAVVWFGWDRESRDCRRLAPLWTDLTAAVPHIAMAPDEARRRAPAQRRYRMTIEIRDALLHLRRHADGDGHDDIRGDTLRIVRSTEIGLVAYPGDESADRHDVELRYLLNMARRWPEAKRAYFDAHRSPRLSAARGNR